MLIQRMRDGSEGVMAKIIIGLIIIVFAMFGFGSITTFLAPVAKVAVVNGEEITQQEMEIAVERNRRMLLARDTPANQIDEDALRQDVLERLISRQLLIQATSDMGLAYGDAGIDREIVQTEMFQLDGVFNPDQFQMVIGGAGYSPLGYRDELRTDKLNEQLISGIINTAFVTDAEAERYGGLLAQKRDIAYLRIAVTDLLDTVSVSDEEISEYYNDNTSDFVTDETVDIQYIELNRDDLAASIDVDETALLQYYNDNLAVYTTDESRRIAHILIEVTGERSLDEARAAADEVYAKIIDGGDFASLAKENSDDLGSSENGGDLGFNTEGTFFPEFEAVAYDLGLNEVSRPVETEIGFHIIKVLDIQDSAVTEFADVRAELEQAYRLSETEEDFVSTSSRLAELLFENFSELESTAAELGLEVKTTGHLKRDDNHPLMSDNRVATAAFSPDVLLDGNNSDLIEIDDNYHIGLRVLEHKPSASVALEEVSHDIRYILQREKATRLAEERADAIVAAIEGGSLAQYVADEYELAWKVEQGASRFASEVDPQIVTESFKLPRPAENKESLGSVILSNGDSVVIRVSGVENGDSELEGQFAGLKGSIAAQMGSGDFQEFRDSLRAEAEIEQGNL